MAEETVRVDSNEDLDSLIQRLKRSGSKEVVLAVPEDARALQTLDQFNVLRREVKEAGLDVTFMGGNKTTRGLAKILGFHTREGNVPGTGGGNVEAASVAAPVGFGTLNDATIPFPTPNVNGNGNGTTRSFGGPPSGFVVNGNGNGAGTGVFPSTSDTLTPPPANRSAQDFFSEVQNFQPGFATNLTPPPMTSNGFNDNGLGREGDTVLSRDSISNFFDDVPNEAAPPRPRADFNFGGGGGDETGGRTMSFEEAMRSGVLAGNDTDDNDFAFGSGTAVDNDIAYGDDGPDTALGNFQTGGAAAVGSGKRVRGGRAPRGGTKTRNRPAGTTTRIGRNIAVPAGLAALGGRVRQVFVPVKPPAPGTAGMMRPEIDPVTRRQRQRNSRRTTIIGVVAVAVVIILILFLLLPSITGNSNPNTGGPIVSGTTGGANAVDVTLLMKDQPATTQNVQLLFTPGDGSGASSGGANAATTTSAATTTAAANGKSTAAATGGANAATTSAANSGPASVPVTTIDTGQITANGSYPAFGGRNISTPAQGTAKILNGGPGTGFSAGALIYTNSNTGIHYYVVNGVSVPAGSIFSPGVAYVKVIAEQGSGSKGNISGFTVTYSNGIVGVQAGPITGGQDKTVKVVSQKDQEALQNQLVSQAQQQAQSQVQGKYDSSTQGIVPIPTGNPTCVFNPSAGQDAPDGKFTGNCKVSFKAYVYNKSDLQKVVAQQVNVSSDQKIDSSTLTLDTSKGQLSQQNGQNYFNVPVTFATYNNLDASAVKSAIAGKSPDQAKSAILSQFADSVNGVDFGKFNGSTLPSADNLNIKMSSASDASASSTATADAAGTPTTSQSSGATGSASATTTSAASASTPKPTSGS